MAHARLLKGLGILYFSNGCGEIPGKSNLRKNRDYFGSLFEGTIPHTVLVVGT